METLQQQNILANTDNSTSDVIVRLLNVRTKKQLENIFWKFFGVFNNNQSLLCFLISKKNNKRLIGIDINFPKDEKSSFEKELLCLLSLKKITDDNFKQSFISSEFYSASYGLSLHYDRNASFYRMPHPINATSNNFLPIINLAPYIHAALNNIQYHERVDNDKVGLSYREKQVIEWVSKGKTNKEIGIILAVSQFTIKNHIANIYVKLNVVNRAQAIEKVIRLDCLA